MDGLDRIADSGHAVTRLRSLSNTVILHQPVVGGGVIGLKSAASDRDAVPLWGSLHRLQKITPKSHPYARFIRPAALTTPVSFRSLLRTAAYK